MRPRSKHPELPGWIRVALVFGAGFAIAWWVSSASSERSPQPAGVSPDPTASPEPAAPRTAEVRAFPARADRLAEIPQLVTEPVPTVEPGLPASAVRRSRLPEWMRFRYEHPHLAYSIEEAMHSVLDNPIPLHEAAKACASKENLHSVRDLDLSAEIEVRGRDVAVRGWGCDANEDPVLAGRICDCILAHLPDEFHVPVLAQVPDKDLVPYDGMLSLRLWL